MGWREDIAYMDQALRIGQARTPSLGGGFGTARPFGSFAAPSLSQRSSRAMSWSDVAQGRLQPRVQNVAAPDKNPLVSGVQKKGLDTLQFQLPYSSSGPRSPYEPPAPEAPQDTAGDLIGSLGGQLGSLTKNLTLANFIPFFMERVNVAAHDLADAADASKAAIPFAGLAPAIATGTDAFINAVQAASDVVGPVIDWPQTFVRDQTLQTRGSLYRSVVNGSVPDNGPISGAFANPLATLGTIYGFVTNPTGFVAQKQSMGTEYNPFAPVFGRTPGDVADEARHWQRVLMDSADPQGRFDAQQRLAILRDSIDLPESVKLQIAAKPTATDDEITKWLDEAPEGRQWSYEAGPAGIAQNLATPLLFYGAELLAGFGAAGGVSALGGGLSAAEGAGAYATGLRTAGAVLEGSVKSLSLAAKAQTAMTAAGVGVTAVDTIGGSIARYVGDEAAVEWFDKANRTTPFSDDPMVQLVTSFAVNPFQTGGLVTKGVKKGLLTLRKGFTVPLDAALGTRLNKFYSTQDQIDDIARRMFMPDATLAQATAFIDENGLRPHIADMIVGHAGDLVLDGLPAAERMALNAMFRSGPERTSQVIAKYGERMLDIIEQSPQLIASRFRVHDWNYRMMDGPFNAEAAAKIALAYRRMMERTYDFRWQDNATVTMRRDLTPEGQRLAREALDDATDAAGTVSMHDWQLLQADLPVLGKFSKGLVTGEERIARSTLDRVIERAAADYALKTKTNPVRMRTGNDPVLRPDSPTPLRDQAEALGTSVETIQAVYNLSDTTDNALDQLRRTFLVDQMGRDAGEVARLTPEEVMQQAYYGASERVAPWEAMGARLKAADEQIARLEAELARVESTRPDRTTHDVTVRLRRQIAELRTLQREVGDPEVTFASRIAGRLRNRSEAERAARKVDAMDRLDNLSRIEAQLEEGTENIAKHNSEVVTRHGAPVPGDFAGLGELQEAGYVTHYADVNDLDRVVAGPDGHGRWVYDDIPEAPAGLLDDYLGARMNVPAFSRTRTTYRHGAGAMDVDPLHTQYIELQRETDPFFKTGEKVVEEVLTSRGEAESLHIDAMSQGEKMAALIRSRSYRASLERKLSKARKELVETLDLVARKEAAGSSWVGEAAIPIKGLEDDIARMEEWIAYLDSASEILTKKQLGSGRGALFTSNPEGYAIQWQTDRQGAIDRLLELRQARDATLDGSSRAAVKRTAALKVPDDYIAQAQADKAARASVYDAEYEAFWHPRNIAKVDDITRNPDELWRALRQVAEEDPAVMDGIRAAAAKASRPEPRPVVEAMTIDAKEVGDNATLRRFINDDPDREGFGYHLSTKSAFPSIRERGLVPKDPRNGDAVGVYFGEDARALEDYVPHANRGGDTVLLRSTRERLDPSLENNNELISKDTIYPDELEYLGADGVWHPLIPGREPLSPWPEPSRQMFDDDENLIAADRPPRTPPDLSAYDLTGADPLAVGVEDVFNDASYAMAVRSELVPPGFEAPVEGFVREATDLDFLTRGGQADEIAKMQADLIAKRDAPAEPTPLPQAVAADTATKAMRQKRSYTYRKKLDAAGLDHTAPPSAAIMARAENRTGLQVLSVLNHGTLDTKPATLGGVISLLHDIETGAGTRAGFGPEMLGEAQRVARRLLDDALSKSRRASRDPESVGRFRMYVEDEAALAAKIDPMLEYDSANPFETLTYGIGKAPSDAVVMEWSQVPGLAEDLMSKRFIPYSERAGVAQVRQAFNAVFGPTSNRVIKAQSFQRWVERLAEKGISYDTAKAAWQHLDDFAHDSRTDVVRRDPTGRVRVNPGDFRWYANAENIPNSKINALIHGVESGREPGLLRELAKDGRISLEEQMVAQTIDYAEVLRESTSFVRRTLKDKVPLGKELASAYGLLAHNSVVTTYYFWYRFGLDARYHAMNYFEAQILYAGRAGLKRGEIDSGLLGMSEGYLRNLAADTGQYNGGLPFTRTRHEWAYRTFVKEQPEYLRRGMKGLASEDEGMVQRAFDQMVRNDPQLRDMMIGTDGTIDYDTFIKELDSWHGKLLSSVDEAGDATAIADEMALALRDAPELAQVYDRLGQLNRDLWGDVRQTFYGNPDRSRAERFLNSYLLFWPLSYQIKSTKWFLRVLGDRAGGLQTNAVGAYVLNDLADTHNRLLSTDTEYRDWFEKHPTLVFIAQMMFPVSFDQTGVSLNPILRGIFFDRDPYAALRIGPSYTVSLASAVGKELGVDLFPEVGDVKKQAAASPP